MILNILNDKVTWKLLLLISYESGRGYYFRDFKEVLNTNNSSIYKAINKLKFYNILTQKKTLYKLNFENNQTQVLLNILEQDKKKFQKISSNILFPLIDFISEIDKNDNIKQIILFGSVAKRTNKKNSDIDLAIIQEEKEDLYNIQYKIEQEYNLRLDLHYFSVEEFKNNKKSKLLNEIKRDGIELI